MVERIAKASKVPINIHSKEEKKEEKEERFYLSDDDARVGSCLQNSNSVAKEERTYFPKCIPNGSSFCTFHIIHTD